MPPPNVESLLPALGFAAAGLALAALLLRLLSRQDHRTWVMSRAPSLPVRTLAVGDDAWIRGAAHAEAPLACPHFDVACISYRYARERKHEWTTRDKDGNVRHHSEWRTEHSERAACDFELDDGDRVLVRAEHAENEAEEALRTDHETTRLRHTAHVLEVGTIVSVLGVKRDDGSFGCASEVPCLWTRSTREQRVRASAGSETGLFVGAVVAAAAGGAGAAAWLVARQPRPEPLLWAVLLPAALVAAAPIWWVGVFNRFVRLRQQVAAAFRQLDVDLAVRAGLVPNLVAVVQAHAAHERALLEHLAAMRASGSPAAAAAAHVEAGRAARAMLLLHERAPELRSDALYRDLHDRLWAVEEKLQHARSVYNDIASEWNARIAHVPPCVVARTMRCRPAPLLGADDAPLPPRLAD